MSALRPTLLDCTLRDGGNQNDWRFTPEQVAGIVTGLDDARVDFIEVGYRGGSGSKKGDAAGAAAECDREYLASLPETSHSQYALMVVPSVAPIESMSDLADSAIELVRIAVYPWDAWRAPEYVDAVHALGKSASVNLMALSYVDHEELAAIARSIAPTLPEVFYVADSFGALTPEQVAADIGVLHAELSSALGIHVHNNLGLAAANTLAALGAGATWIDSSLCGMARGAGNLPTEQAAAILASHASYRTDVEIPAMGALATYVADEVLAAPMKTGVDEISAGLNNHHYYYLPILEAAGAAYSLDPHEVGRRLGKTRPHSVTRELVDEICQSMKEELS